MQTSEITSKEIKLLIIVGFVAMCGGLGIDIHLASMPAIMKALGTNKEHMQQSVSLYILGMGVGQLFYGSLSDKYGRKPILIIGLLFASFMSFPAAFVTNISSLLILRILQGFGAGVCFGLGRTIVADVLEPEVLARIGAYFSLMISISPLFAPTLGGYIQFYLGWQANFIVLGSILLLACALYGFFIPETNNHKNPKAFSLSGLLESGSMLLRHPIFVGAMLCSGIAMGANIVYATLSSFIFQDQYHVSPVVYGWIAAMTATSSVFGKLVAPSILKRVGILNGLLIGILLILTAGLFLLLCIFAGALSIVTIILGVFIAIFGLPFIMSTAMPLALSSFHKNRGLAGAMYGSFQTLIAFVASALVGAVAFYDDVVLAISYVILGLSGVLIYTRLILKNTKNQ